jgi:branched-chain amino acid transport system ATP-binding protein
MTLLDVQGVCKAFGGVVAAKDVSFSVGAGELLALIGPNGAGKTTTFNIVGGQLAPDAGNVVLEGETVTRLTPREKFRRGIGRTFQVAQTFPSMTLAENVQMALISHRGRTASVGRRCAGCSGMRRWRFSPASAWPRRRITPARRLHTAT